MRFGMMVAAAATVLCAGQADAATWLRYTLSGNGTVTTGDGITSSPANPQDITFSFVIDADQYPAFSYSLAGTNVNATGDAMGIAVSGSQQPDTKSLITFNANASFNGVAANNGFATSVPTGAAMGMLTYTNTFSTPAPVRIDYRANITRVSISRVADFAAPTISAVPEPTTWGMMIVGVAVLGFALRRRPRVAVRMA